MKYLEWKKRNYIGHLHKIHYNSQWDLRLGEFNPTGKTIRKLLSVFPESWRSKVEAITEFWDVVTL